MVLVASCGEPVPSAQPHTVADDGYLLSFTRTNLVESEAAYHFQLCRQQEGATTEDMETDTEGLETDEQACFNPFEDKDGNPVMFTAMPAADGLRTQGVGGKVLRYAVGTAAVLVFGALAFVLTPKAAHLAFTKMVKLHKTILSEEADDVIEHIAKRSTDKANKKAIKKASKKAAKETTKKAATKDENFDYEKHYTKAIKDKMAALSIFKTKPALFFTSLFIVEGTIWAWKFSYDSWRDSNKQLAKWNWGQGELDLAAAYPFLASNNGDPYRVTNVKELLATLRQHLQLIYSAAYLREFPPPPKEKATSVNPLPW